MKRAFLAVAALPLAIAAGCGGSSGSSTPASAGGSGSSTGQAASRPAGAEPSVIALDPDAMTVTLPLFTGSTTSGKPIYYIVTDASTPELAKKYGVNAAPKLARALGTKAVQTVTSGADGIVFPGTVDFSKQPKVVPSATGFPPTSATPGPVADAKYSPLVTTGDGAVLDAPQVANDTGMSSAVVSIDVNAKTATLRLLDGFVGGTHNYYVRTDGSIPLLAAIESSIYAPSLNAAPGLGSDDPATSSRSAIVPVVNGPRKSAGADQRQGLQSALLGEGSPNNIEQDPPGSPNYSPLWDVTPVVWTPKAVKAGRVRRLTSVADVAAAVKLGDLTGAGMGTANPDIGVAPLRAVSNCSIVAIG